MFTTQILCKKVILKPNEIVLSRKNSSASRDELINNILLDKIKENYGDRCVSNGYLDGSSIEIVERTIGKIIASHLNGDIIYDVRFSANICNPIKGMEITATVENINKMGIMAKVKPLVIVLARQHHINRKCFKNITVGQEIKLVVVGSRFELNDKEISVIGYLGEDYLDETSSEEEAVSELDDISSTTNVTLETDDDSALF